MTWTWLIATVCVLGLLAGAAAPAGELVPFAPPWDDGEAGPTDLSDTLPSPAGARGWIAAREDGHLYLDDQRVRLFGANVTGAACFPDHPTAERIAARMAKFGINAVRFHFLDATWGEPRLIDYASGDNLNFKPDSLDRLDYFISQLRQHGIYINLNLLVGRRFGVGDGVDPQIQEMDWKAQHAVGFFHRPHLESQQAYARKLLTHRNAYTKLRYIDDPAVAIVEINNENGLMHAWLGGQFEGMPTVFARDLKAQWNAWLSKRYESTSELAKAWRSRDVARGDELLEPFALEHTSWSLEQHAGARVDATIEEDGKRGVLEVRRPGQESWHIQLNRPGLAIKKDEVYTFSFRARADEPRTINVSVMQAHAPWRALGLSARCELRPKWQRFEFTFVATEDDANARAGWSSLSQAGAKFEFEDASFRKGGRVGLEPFERLEDGSIEMLSAGGKLPILPAMQADWIRFLWETERAHWRAMRSFLKDELGCKALVTGTIASTSTPNLMADFDIVDTHAYWKHPRFPGRQWDRSNWYVENAAMVDTPSGTLGSLAAARVAGKPHMVSEYNHPAPNPHAGAGPLLLAAYGAMQDWDVLFMYTYSHGEMNTKAGRIPDFFDIGQHPTIMANLPAASLMFRRADVAPGREVVRFALSEGDEISRIAGRGAAWHLLSPERVLGDLRVPLVRRTELVVGEMVAAVMPNVPPVDPASLEADTKELLWTVKDERGRVLVRSPRTKALIGAAGEEEVELGDGVAVSVGPTQINWCTVSLTLLEGESFRQAGRALLVASGYTENTDMGWKDEAKTTVGRDWGKPPSLVEAVDLRLTVPGHGARLYPLDQRGQRMGEPVEGEPATNGTVFDLAGQPTVWFELVTP